MAIQWLDDVPLELREEVYKHFFNSTKVTSLKGRFGDALENFTRSCSKSDTNAALIAGHNANKGSFILDTAPLNLFLTSKRVKEEAEQFFWSLSYFTHQPFLHKFLTGAFRFDCVKDHRLDRIQHLTLQSCTEALIPETSKIFDEITSKTGRKMQSLEIFDPLTLIIDFKAITQVFKLSKHCVNHLRLTVVLPIFEIPWAPVARIAETCQIEVRDTYNIFMTLCGNGDRLGDGVKALLRLAYTREEHEKVTFIEKKCVPPLDLRGGF